MLLCLQNSMEVIHFRHPQMQDFKIGSPVFPNFYLLCCVWIFQGLAKNKQNRPKSAEHSLWSLYIGSKVGRMFKYIQQVISHPYTQGFMKEKDPVFCVIQQSA